MSDEITIAALNAAGAERLARITHYREKAAAKRDAGDAKNAGFYDYLIETHQSAYDQAWPALQHVASIGVGCTLRHKSRDSWATFFPDASVPGSFRYQLYDAKGFFSHSTHNTLAEAAIDAVDQGYAVPDDAAPARIMTTQTFERGNRIAALIQQVNAGRLSFAEANEQAAVIDAQYAAKASAEIAAA